MVGTVLLHGDGPFERSITDSEGDVVSRRPLYDLTGLITAVACDHFTVDLVGEGERERGGREGREEGREGGGGREEWKGEGRREGGRERG